ncbi:MAG: Rne/Rng family ribonuclease [Gammaproteobacteria bacterium]|nr:Rne/Rng family ribonuclease [Gammaproteobacteria bacterium]
MNDTIKKILINKAYGQLRVAKIEDNKLYDLEIESILRKQKIGNIWNAEVTSLAPSLEAAFVNFGAERNGFLPLREIAPEYFPKNKDPKNLTIKDVLFEGQKILIQISKEERGTKGAALSTYITLAGCYLVLMPNNPKAGGISRRIEGEERNTLREVFDQLKIPREMGVIIRTAGIGKTLEELQWDLDILINLWESIKEASHSHGAPYLIHQESDIAIRAIRDHLREDISEILIDDKEIFDEVYAYVEKVRPDYIDRIKYYDEPISLFSKFKIEKQIESVFNRTVRLPSGGEIVIDRAEALTAIDVNSSRATKGIDIEQTALETNLEAAAEIARQIRIRDLGGLFVIDFIDMEVEANRRKVEDKMYNETRSDRARVQFTHLSRFGLMEMSRQRLRQPLNEAAQIVCPRCHGQGTIRNIVAQALSIIHLIEENAMKENLKQIRVQAPSDTAAFLLNEQRQIIEHIEQQNHISILIIPNPYLENPEYEIECVTSGEVSNSLSYELTTRPSVTYEVPKEEVAEIKKPAVKSMLPYRTAPTRRGIAFKKWISNLLTPISKLFKESKKPTEKPYKKSKPYSKRRPYHAAPQKSERRPGPSRSNYNRSRRTREKTPSPRERRQWPSKPISQEPRPLKPVTEPTKAPQRSYHEAFIKKPEAIEKPKAEPIKQPMVQPAVTQPIKGEMPHKIEKKEPAINTGDFVQIETKATKQSIQALSEASQERGRPRKEKPITAAQVSKDEELEKIETKT